MPRFVIACLIAAAIVFALTPNDSHAAQQRRPNIVLFITDDMGYRDIGAFGQDKIRTPNIDRLAADGMMLTSLYSGNTVCAPSRSVLMSGLHPGHTFVRDNRQAGSDKRGTTGEGQTPVPPDHLQLPRRHRPRPQPPGAFGNASS